MSLELSFFLELRLSNIPVDEAIQILADKASNNNWFNNTYDLQLEKEDPVKFDGELYEQIDGVAMGSLLGPLLEELEEGVSNGLIQFKSARKIWPLL